ncbi:pentatricopeptide repeat-containing protein At5g47360 [Euphorbia lathyris]|uniref:pentatricopeptide repeat-containing protein At5g47360 n=1 Tax=Euphorbia lathyris TaxID=212925 RepID=UPI003313900D
MSIYYLTRFLSHPITSKTPKISNLRYTTSSLPDELYTRLQKNQSNTEKALNSIKAKLDSKCVNEVMDKCSLNNSQIGLRFFVWAGNQSNYRHSDFMYSKACRLFKIKQNPKVVLDLIEVFRSDKCAVTVKTIKVLLNLCKQCSLADEALVVLRKMPEFGLRADAVAYNTVIRLFCEKGDMDVAQKLMGEMGLIDLYSDMITYISMIKGFCDIGRVEEACGLLKEMRNRGCVPNVVAYSTILDGLCKFGSVEKALELLGAMEKEGGNCSPNVLTYTSVIQSLCEKGRAIDAFAVLDRMEAYGCPPNRVTVSTFLKGLCMEGHVEEAYKLIDRVVMGGSISYGECYSSLVVCLIRIKNVEEAEKLLRKMLVSGHKPDGLACSLMIKALCFNKRVLDGYHLHDEIEKIGLLSTMDSDICSILLAGLCQEGNSVEAVKLARSMLQKKISIKHPYVNKVLHHLKKLGDEELVTELATIGR